jgi:hypothetical protein
MLYRLAGLSIAKRNMNRVHFCPDQTFLGQHRLGDACYLDQLSWQDGGMQDATAPMM